jgi:fumarate reductase flavoprotein subunit
MRRHGTRSKRSLIVLSAILFLFVALLQGPDARGAEEKKFLADRHQARGMTCASCHKEEPPKAAVPASVCLGCHGSYARIAEKTLKVEPNPHASHMGEVSCDNCHHGHKASENQCLTCHQFNFKTP